MRHNMLCSYWSGLLGIAVVLLGCTSSNQSTSTSSGDSGGDTGKLTIVTTTGMVTDLVRNIVADRADVQGLLGDVDPHLYKPTRSDVKRLLSADVVVYSGLRLEGRMEDAFENVRKGGTPIFAATDGVERDYLRVPPEMEGHQDPHVWMDVAAWSRCVQHVADKLCEIDAANADVYRENAKEYRAQLEGLDSYVKKTISSIPEAQRALVTAHDAFGYFSQAYEIPVLSPQGVSTEAEAGVKQINELVSLVVERKIRAVFGETSVSDQNMKAIIAGAASRDWEVKLGEQLFSDAMGPQGTYRGTYIGMIDHNATTIARTLGGTAPEGGFQGKLKP